MTKPKQRNTHSATAKKKKNQDLLDAESPYEEGWTIVKKQRITILVSALPISELCKTPDAEDDQLQETPQETNSEMESPLEVSEPVHSATESEKSISLSSEHAVPPKPIHPHKPTLLSEKLPSLPQGIGVNRSACHGFGQAKGTGVCSSAKVRKKFMVFADKCKLPNHTMRLSYLEKKLKRAGGLENWLVSLGLSRFIKIFQAKNVNKFKLASLTMEKLKDMGADAVGPRRKLIHAIECLCDPHCFQHV